jgi:D-alanyl-D-alanine carboxypeptidase (penicillin-binding protein 5/6)
MSFKKLIWLLVALTLIFIGIQYFRPIPQTTPESKPIKIPLSDQVYLPWPAYGQAALGANGYGLLETHGQQTPMPIASIAKVITALSVLKQKPINVSGYQGPVITISAEDVANYNAYYLQGGSVTKVAAGEQINEYQALQAMLLPSSNNLSDTIARWAFGSIDNYVNFANQYMKQLGAKQTSVADASGISSSTVSTAEDLVKIGLVATQDPTISEIVKQEAAEIPVAGIIRNVNWLLGTDGVVGIKTGNTEQAGGCYLFAANRKVAGETIQTLGAVLGAHDLNTAIADAHKIIVASDSGFTKITIAKKGDVLGEYKTRWNSVSNAVAESDLTLLAWKDLSTGTSTKLEALTTAAAGTEVGSVKAMIADKTVQSSVVLGSDISQPPFFWRIFH